jgi:hypothetical protein
MLSRTKARSYERKGRLRKLRRGIGTPEPAAARRENCHRAGPVVSMRVYLRAAQAYMLISMPTGTSTIFGVFQFIPSSQKNFGVNSTPRLKLGPCPAARKCDRSSAKHLRARPDSHISLLDKAISLLDKVQRRLVNRRTSLALRGLPILNSFERRDLAVILGSSELAAIAEMIFLEPDSELISSLLNP